MRKSISKKIVALATAMFLGAGMIGSPIVSKAQEKISIETATETDALVEDVQTVMAGEEAEYVELSAANFPDPKFRDYLAETLTVVQVEGTPCINVKAVTELKISIGDETNAGSVDITGYEKFKYLKSFQINNLGYGNKCFISTTSYDFSFAPNLNLVEINLPCISELKVNNNPELEYLHLGTSYENGRNESITTVDVSKNQKLKSLICGFDVKTLDLSHNPELTYLFAEGSSLKTLDFSHNPKMDSIRVGLCQLTSLNISNCKDLRWLECQGNQLSSLNLENNAKLETLFCDNNKITTLNVSKNTGLNNLSCSNNKLASLDLSRNLELDGLNVEYNNIRKLDLSKNIVLAVKNNYISCDIMDELILPTNYKYNIELHQASLTGKTDLSFLKNFDFSLIKDAKFDIASKTIKYTATKRYDYPGIVEYEYIYKIPVNDTYVQYWSLNGKDEVQREIYLIGKSYTPYVAPSVTTSYHTHIQSLGDSQGTKTNGQMAGTSGMAKRLENIWIKVDGNKNLGIQYSTHCQTYGWLPWSTNGEANGTSGEAKRLEAIKIQLTGSDKNEYDVYYRVHAQSYGWLAWAKNGEPSGTAGYGKRLEGIQVVVKKKGEAAPGLDYADVKASAGVHNDKAYIAKTAGTITIPGSATDVNVMYKTHVQSFGWQTWVTNGEMSGTSGKAKRLEGINIKLSNSPYSGGIQYMTHIQSYGWEKQWKADGAMSGTSGQAKRLEAIKIQLTGEMAKHYDVYYRVHAQSFGWLGWAKNGEESGTAGLAKRLEGIQIVLVPKGQAAPGTTYQNITSVKPQAYIKK